MKQRARNFTFRNLDNPSMQQFFLKEAEGFLKFQIHDSGGLPNDGPMVSQTQMAEAFHNWLNFGGTRMADWVWHGSPICPVVIVVSAKKTKTTLLPPDDEIIHW